jgi:hypothetical protein
VSSDNGQGEPMAINLEELRVKMISYKDLHLRHDNPSFMIARIQQDISELEHALATIEHMTFIYASLPTGDSIDLGNTNGQDFTS